MARAGGKTAKYVYGVVRARSKSGSRLKGIYEEPLRLVTSGNLGALTSDVPDGPLEAGREELMADQRRVVDRLAQHALAVNEGEPMHEHMAVNASFLVDQAQLAEFDRAVDELGSQGAHKPQGTSGEGGRVAGAPRRRQGTRNRGTGAPRGGGMGSRAAGGAMGSGGAGKTEANHRGVITRWLSPGAGKAEARGEGLRHPSRRADRRRAPVTGRMTVHHATSRSALSSRCTTSS